MIDYVSKRDVDSMQTKVKEIIVISEILVYNVRANKNFVKSFRLTMG